MINIQKNKTIWYVKCFDLFFCQIKHCIVNFQSIRKLIQLVVMHSIYILTMIQPLINIINICQKINRNFSVVNCSPYTTNKKSYWWNGKDYQYYCISCKYFFLYWTQVNQLLLKINIDRFITLIHIVLGYKVCDKDYLDFNYF